MSLSATTSPSSSPSSSSSKSSASASDMTRRMICGGVAGMIAKTATNPLDRIRMLSQTGEHGIVMPTTTSTTASTTTTTTRSSHKVGVVALYKNIIQREGIAGLWAGNGANLLRVFPAKAVVFSSNDFFRKLLLNLNHNNNTKDQNSNTWNGAVSFLAGGLSGMTASAATYPLDLARGRISGKLAPSSAAPTTTTTTTASFSSVKPKKEYHGIVHTLVLTFRDEGIRGLYKGVTPTLLGAMPYEGIKFGTVGLLESLFPIQPQQQHEYNDKTNNNNTTTTTTTTTTTNLAMRKMLFGGIGGIMAGLITYPNDTVRRLMQLQGSRGTTTHYTGYMDCVGQTYRQHGIPRFYKGVGINMVRMAPNTAVQFGSYEILKQWTSEWNI